MRKILAMSVLVAVASLLLGGWQQQGILAPITGAQGAAAGGSVALVAHNAVQSANGSTVTSTATNCTGATLIIVASCVNSTSAPTVSSSPANTWVQDVLENSNSVGASITRVYSPSVSSTMTFTCGGNIDPTCFIACFSGTVGATVDASNHHNNAANSATFQPGSMTPTHAGDVGVTVVCDGQAGDTPFAIDSSFTKLDEFAVNPGNGEGGAFGYKLNTGTSAINLTWTASGGTNWLWGAVAAYQ